MKKMFVLIASLLIVLTGCINSESEKTTGGKTKSGDLVLPAFSVQSPDIQDYDNNDLTKLIEKKFNVEIKWTLSPEEGALEKQQLLMASGNYPAIFFGGDFNQNDQVKFGKNGAFIPLNDLIEEHAPNIKTAFKQKPYYEKGVTAPDGNIYALPGLEECYHCDYSQKMYINVKWLEKLGLNMPATTEELETVLKAFKENDPNGNGKQDEIPLTGAIKAWHGEPNGFLMNAFIYDNEMDYFSMENGKVDFVANKPEWKQGLEYISRLYDQGLIDPQAFTQQEEGLNKLNNNPGDVIVGAFTNGCCTPTVEKDGRWTEYEVVPPLKGPKGVQFAAYYGGGVGNASFAITDKATKEQQIAAIKIVDYLFSKEGSLDAMYGPKEVGWFDPKEGEFGINGKPALYNAIEPWQREDKDKRSVTWENGLKYTPREIFEARAQNQDITKPDGYEVYLSKMTDRMSSYKPIETFPISIWLDPEKAQQIAQMRTDINTYVQINTVQFITGQKDINKDWDDYVKGFNGLGLSDYLSAYQKAYDNMYK
ncbi:extracellular solute-binding protein [Neobacillus sp. NPDC093182]|uniref:extracellular solute-binding protein n=1 Tax=Neobacillus sp. NPDC093182 TaxID=3364297 RepID=UPI00382032AF